MKKYIIIAIAIISLISIPFLNISNQSSLNAKTLTQKSDIIKGHTREELYRDIFVTMFDPYIQKAINYYYGKPYSYDLWDVKILRIDRPNGYRTFNFVIKLQITPFEGAHNTVGIDNITLRVEPGSVKVEKFKHIKSFNLPPHFSNEVK